MEDSVEIKEAKNALMERNNFDPSDENKTFKFVPEVCSIKEVRAIYGDIYCCLDGLDSKLSGKQ